MAATTRITMIVMYTSKKLSNHWMSRASSVTAGWKPVPSWSGLPMVGKPCGSCAIAAVPERAKPKLVARPKKRSNARIAGGSSVTRVR